MRRSRSIRLFLLFAHMGLTILFGFNNARADLVNNEWYSSPSSLGKGNTGIASSDDPTTAMFYNPAGLSKVKRSGIELFNVHLETGTGNFTLTNMSNVSKHGSLSEIQPELAAHRNTGSSFSVSTYPSFYTRNFAFGVLGKAEYYSVMNNDGVLDARARYLLVPTLGMSAGLMGGFFRIGAAVRGIQITSANQELTSYSNLGYLNNAVEGFGIGVDAGLLWTFMNSGLGTLGLVARNIGGTSLSGAAPMSFAGGSPAGFGLMKQTYDAGISFTPRFSRDSTGHFAIEYRDALGQNKVKVARRVNLGTEVNFSRVFSLRMGISRGYFTAGFGVNSRRAIFEIGTYGEEMDASAFRLKQDRRVFLRFGGKF